VGDSRIHGTYIALMAASIELDEEIYSDSGTHFETNPVQKLEESAAVLVDPW
jgi:hypothetical protein